MSVNSARMKNGGEKNLGGCSQVQRNTRKQFTHIIRVPCFPADVIGHPPLFAHRLALVYLGLCLAQYILHNFEFSKWILLHVFGDLYMFHRQV